MKTKIKLLGLTLLLSINTPILATNKALLIGISDYQDKSTQDLEGAANDVIALKKVLQKYWKFDATNIKTLINSDATKKKILQALTQLKNNAKADDHIFIYYSGHGSSSYDQNLASVIGSFGNSTGALLPYEFKQSVSSKQQILDNLIIAKRDLKPIFLELDKTNAHTFIAFDTCYSGNTVRSVSSNAAALVSRNQDIDYDYDDDESPVYDLVSEHKKNKAEAYPYQNITYLAAASPKEPAADISQKDLVNFPTIDNKPHGVFTDALLRGLSGELKTDQNVDGKTIYNELLTSIKAFLVAKGHKQIPQILPATEEDKKALRYQSLLGQRNTLGANIKLPDPVLTVYVDSAANKSELISHIKQLSQIKISSQRAELNLKKVGHNYVMTNLSGDEICTLKSPSDAKILGRIEQEAWKKQFSRKLQKHAAINLELSVNEGAMGDVLVEGDQLAFLVRSEKPIYLLLLNVESEGAISLLYPFKKHELARIPAYKVKYLPSENKDDWIVVQKPFGTEYLIAVGFTEKPDFLEKFIGQETLIPNSDLYKQLMSSLKVANYGFSVLNLYTLAKKP